MAIEPVDPGEIRASDFFSGQAYRHIEGDGVGNFLRKMNGDTRHPNLLTQIQLEQQQFIQNLVSPPLPFFVSPPPPPKTW